MNTPNVTFQNITQVLLDTLDQMYLLCMTFALLVLFLSIYRNYNQFGEYMGIKYLVALLLTVVLIVVFPVAADHLFKGMLAWGREAGARVEDSLRVLMSVELDGGWLDKVVIGLVNVIYKSSIWMGRFIRELMIIVCCGLFIILKTLSPIFIAMLAVPETKSIGVNFLLLTFGFVMMPLCMVFGDLTMVWIVCQIWEHTGMAIAAAGALGVSGAAGGALAALAFSPPGAIVVAAGAAGILTAFACIFILLCVVVYVGIPWACMSLFRGAGIGNALAMSLNTVANVMSMNKSAQGMGKIAGQLGGNGKKSSSASSPKDSGGK